MGMTREDEEKLRQILQHLPAGERPLWIAEANRLAGLVERYQRLKPKRENNPVTGRPEGGVLRGREAVAA